MRKFLKSFVYAIRGIAAGVSGQRNIKIMLGISVLVISLSYFLQISHLEWAVVLLTCGLVLAIELINTAGEKLVDVLSPEFDSRYGEIKDILAGASLVVTVAAVGVGIFIFGSELWQSVSGCFK